MGIEPIQENDPVTMRCRLALQKPENAYEPRYYRRKKKWKCSTIVVLKWSCSIGGLQYVLINGSVNNKC